MIEESNFIEINTWENDIWTITEFKTRQDFINFLLPLFKEPGKYMFDDTTYVFNEQSRKFSNDKFYCSAVEGSLDYRKYWDDQKHKCKYGAIFKNNGKLRRN